MTRASTKLDRSRVNSEGGHYVASFFVPLPTIGMNSYDLLNFFYKVILFDLTLTQCSKANFVPWKLNALNSINDCYLVGVVII